MAHDVRRTSSLIREGAQEAPPYAFPQMNAGVMLYRRSAAMLAFLREWQRRYDAAGKLRDQPTLRDLLWAGDLRFYVLPPEFNLRRVTVLDAWEPLDARPTILHSHRLLQHLRGAEVRLDSLAAVLPEERLARAEEWRAAGLPDPAAGGDAVLRLSDGRGAGDGAGGGGGVVRLRACLCADRRYSVRRCTDKAGRGGCLSTTGTRSGRPIRWRGWARFRAPRMCLGCTTRL